VIVSQIIRSPGVYFEKNKNQKNRKQFKRKLSTDINKLRSFLPLGEALISEFDLFLAIPILIKSVTADGKEEEFIIPLWNINSVYYYSIKYLQETKKSPSLYFLQCFKYYRLISKNSKLQSKSKSIQLLLKWLRLKNTTLYLQEDLSKNKVVYILKYFKFLLKLLKKQQILRITNYELITRNLNEVPFLGSNFTAVEKQIIKLVESYDQTIVNSQRSAQINLSSQLLLITKRSENWISEMDQFSFFKQSLYQTTSKAINFIQFI
jgi:hypothetical protein